MSFGGPIAVSLLHIDLGGKYLGNRAYIHSAFVNCAAVFQSGLTTLYSCRQSRIIPAVPHPHRPLVSYTFLILAILPLNVLIKEKKEGFYE